MNKVLIIFLTLSCMNAYGDSSKPLPIKFKDGKWVRDLGKKNETIFYEEDSYKWYLTYRIAGEKVEDIKLNGEEAVSILNNKLMCKPMNEVSLSFDGKYKGGRFKKVFCFSSKEKSPLEIETYCHKENNQFNPIKKLEIETAVVRIECGK